jgi:hypothetical protein
MGEPLIGGWRSQWKLDLLGGIYAKTIVAPLILL